MTAAREDQTTTSTLLTEAPAAPAPTVGAQIGARAEAEAGAALAFPPKFIWGAGTAAYQIEGAAADDGRGPSIWDTFSRTPGRVRNGDTGDRAVDHYHRYEQDVALMAQLGLRAYRFSVAWPRIQPDGRGPVNQRGLDYYRRLVDCLLDHDVEPWITLYHWDLPQALQDLGGWPQREVAERFADFAQLVYGALHDRVHTWATMNEPWCSAFLGYGSGRLAPGVQDPHQALRAAHHLMLGHGRAITAMRAIDPGNHLGITLDFNPAVPASGDPADVDMARQVNGLRNRFFLDAILRGAYPADVLRDLERFTDLAHLRDGDQAVIGMPIDLLGVNYYNRALVAAGPPGTGTGTEAGAPMLEFPGAETAVFVPQEDRPRTARGWPVDPDGLYDLLLWLHREYPPMPLAVTENGAAFDDYADPEGQVHDPDRISFLDGHFRAAQRAIAEGVDLRGYFVWSLLDNYEWEEGYSKRFGLIYVDYPTQQRVLKDSAHWYRQVIARNGLDGQR